MPPPPRVHQRAEKQRHDSAGMLTFQRDRYSYEAFSGRDRFRPPRLIRISSSDFPSQDQEIEADASFVCAKPAGSCGASDEMGRLLGVSKSTPPWTNFAPIHDSLMYSAASGYLLKPCTSAGRALLLHIPKSIFNSPRRSV